MGTVLKDLVVGVVASIVAALLVAAFGLTAGRFKSSTLTQTIRFVRLTPTPKGVLKTFGLGGVLLGILIALGMAAIDFQLESELQTVNVPAAPVYPSPAYFLQQAQQTLDLAHERARARESDLQKRISKINSEQPLPSAHKRGQEEEGRAARTKQIEQMIRENAEQSDAELRAAEKEAELWRSEAERAIEFWHAQAATQADYRRTHPEQREAARNPNSITNYTFTFVETLIWGFFVFSFIAFVAQRNGCQAPNPRGYVAASIVVVVIAVTNTFISSLGVLVVESLLLAAVVYAASDHTLRTSDILVNSPYVVSQRFTPAILVLGIAGLISIAVDSSLVLGGRFLDEADIDPSLPIDQVLNFMTNWIYDGFVVIAGGVYLTALTGRVTRDELEVVNVDARD